jgi:hypothetical protein
MADGPDTPETVAPESPAPAAPQDMTIPTYHLDLWHDPRAYYCLVCATTGYTLASVTAHLLDVHSLEAVPTPLAQQPPELQPLVEETP